MRKITQRKINSLETVSVLLAVVVTATVRVSLLLGCGGGLKLVMMRGSKLPLSSGKARTSMSEISIQVSW